MWTDYKNETCHEKSNQHSEFDIFNIATGTVTETKGRDKISNYMVRLRFLGKDRWKGENEFKKMFSKIPSQGFQKKKEGNIQKCVFHNYLKK